MSLKEWKTHIEEGDMVIAYISRESMIPLRISATETFNNKFGSFHHKDMIGKEFGFKMFSHTGRGFIYLLHPTPELWTLVLTHRTQILYVADISFITIYLDLKPGSKVIESGTGSGSFSHSIARTIAPTGRLYSFEYHAERAQRAKQEFEDNGFGDIIVPACRDVCKEGFGIKDTVHAVFLDLPAPWEAIPHAKEAFKQRRTGKICSFSPCIEQVQRTVTALSENGFSEIKMFECLIRNHDIRFIPITTIADAIAKEKAQERKQKGLDPLPEDNSNSTDEIKEDTSSSRKMITVSRTATEARGHTSYLTFATFISA